MSDSQAIRLTFKGGGWVLAVLAFVVLATVAWAVAPAIFQLGNHSAGDGNTLESYAFDMNNFSLDTTVTVPAMQHRDMSPVLHDPAIYDSEALAISNATQRNQFIVSKDFVVGVELNGESRAYPLHVLNVHEVVNDTLGGIPITVYWNWPSGHTTVFERTVNGNISNFEISGLSGNGNMLLYIDTPEEGGEQLFSPILSASVSGKPIQLTPIIHEITSWESWFKRHPETSSLAPDEQYKKRYRKGDPRTYFLNDTIYFPASPMPNDGINPKAPVIALPSAGGFTAYSIEELANTADENGLATRNLNGNTIVFEVSNSPLYAIARNSEGNTIPCQRALWFTWFANHPNTELVTE